MSYMIGQAETDGTGVTSADIKTWGNTAAALGLTVAQLLQQFGMGTKPPVKVEPPSFLATYGMPIAILAVVGVGAVIVSQQRKGK